MQLINIHKKLELIAQSEVFLIDIEAIWNLVMKNLIFLRLYSNIISQVDYEKNRW